MGTSDLEYMIIVCKFSTVITGVGMLSIGNFDYALNWHNFMLLFSATGTHKNFVMSGKCLDKVLIIDDDVNIGKLLDSYLSSHGYTVTIMHSGKSGIEACKKNTYDFIFCDYRLGDKTGFEVMDAVKEMQPEVRVIMITGYADVKIAVNAIKRGAIDFVIKPLIPQELLSILQSGNKQQTQPGVRYNSAKLTGVEATDGFWDCNSASMREVYDEIKLVAPTDYSVIIYGESGTGKEMIARAIHEKSKRKDHPFIPLDCGTLSRELAGSELFGHIKGSFTGAVTDKVGHFELADKGTLFLDEIGNLPLDVQAALLRVVQERTFRKIGAGVQEPVDVRIIVASNENLQKAYQAGSFREDLYHRFNEFKINLPPLRDRKEDVLPLAGYFLELVNEELNKNILGFDEEVKNILLDYQWPGNLRELKNIIRRTVLLSKDDYIHKYVLPAELAFKQTPVVFEKPLGLTAEQAKTTDLKAHVAKTQKAMIIDTLKAVNNNKTRAALLLNIDRKTLYNKLREFGLTVENGDEIISG